MRVGLTYNMKRSEGGEDAPEPPSSRSEIQAEWDDAETIEAVRRALAERHDVVLFEASATADHRSQSHHCNQGNHRNHRNHRNNDVYESLRNNRPDIVFNIAEGESGPCREGHIPSILEYLGIPYTASDPLTCNACLDKSRAKEILAYHDIPTARFRVVAERNFSFNSLHYPLVVKPLYEGSSIGIRNNSLVRTRQEMRERVTWLLDRYREPALVEEFLPGREFTVAILGNGGEARALPIVEIRFDSLPSGVNPLYSYEAKWIWDQTTKPLEIFDCPARLDEKLRAEIERIALAAYHVMRCRDWCRIDMRLDQEGRPHVIELNPLPGVLPRPEANSCFPKAARAAGLNYNELINGVLDIALRRYGLH